MKVLLAGVTGAIGGPLSVALQTHGHEVVGLTRDLAQQWSARKGIRVNCIAPGFFQSEMSDQYRPGYIESVMSRVVMGRMGDPEELAATLVWLVSDAAGYVTGQTLAVDGGVTIT